MERYAPEKDLAPRDVTARAIMAEEREGRGPVVLDTRILGRTFDRRFPTIAAFLRKAGQDPSESIPVSPGAHFSMGGVVTDESGRTSVRSLLAAGEVACTGLHGANRMGSNSLLEGLVFGRRAGLSALEEASSGRTPRPEPVELSLGDPGDRAGLAGRAWQDLGLFRTESGLKARAAEPLRAPQAGRGPSRDTVEAGNLAQVARAIAGSALARTESRGAHFREDHPRIEPSWDGRHLLWDGGKLAGAAASLHGRSPKPILEGS